MTCFFIQPQPMFNVWCNLDKILFIEVFIGHTFKTGHLGPCHTVFGTTNMFYFDEQSSPIALSTTLFMQSCTYKITQFWLHGKYFKHLSLTKQDQSMCNSSLKKCKVLNQTCAFEILLNILLNILSSASSHV